MDSDLRGGKNMPFVRRKMGGRAGETLSKKSRTNKPRDCKCGIVRGKTKTTAPPSMGWGKRSLRESTGGGKRRGTVAAAL